MKKTLTAIPVVLALAAITGCATSGDLEKMQAQQKLTDAKVEQAMQDARDAKAAADAAKAKADETSARADDAIKAAEAREKAADDKADKADLAFQKSMRK